MKLSLALLFVAVCTAHALNPRAEQLSNDGSDAVIFPRLHVASESLVVIDDTRTSAEATSAVSPAADSDPTEGSGIEASNANEKHIPLDVILSATTEASVENVGQHPL